MVSWVTKLGRKYHWDIMIILVDEMPAPELFEMNRIYAVRHNKIAAGNHNQIGINHVVYQASQELPYYTIYRSDTPTFVAFMDGLRGMQIDEAAVLASRLYPDIAIYEFYHRARPTMRLNTLHLYQLDTNGELYHARYGKKIDTSGTMVLMSITPTK
jgi:hypothetical protein